MTEQQTSEALQVVYKTIKYYHSQGDVYVVRILEQLARDIKDANA